jgi:NAD(P)-dependent dehydrogenase (short-subunit alcohol dehydrogenase family)
MDLALTPKNALVTGASKGIGLAITRSLAAEGAHVVAGARTASDQLADLVDAGEVHEVKADLSTPHGPEELVAAAREHGAIDILVNKVGGVTPRLSGFLQVTDEQWLGSLNLTFMAAVRTTRAVLPDMLAAGHGTIVNTCSVNAFLPDPALGLRDRRRARAYALTRRRPQPPITIVCSSVKRSNAWRPPMRPVPLSVPARPPKGRWFSQ